MCIFGMTMGMTLSSYRTYIDTVHGDAGHAYSSPAHEEAYEREFGDKIALEYLDLIREVVQGQDAEKDAATRAFLEREFAAYSRKTAGVPGDFQTILGVFQKWCEAKGGARVVGGGEAGGGGEEGLEQGLVAKLEVLKTLTLSYRELASQRELAELERVSESERLTRLEGLVHTRVLLLC